MNKLAMIVLAALPAAALSQGATNVWVGPGNGDWSNPANWSLGAVPNNSDTVVFSTNYFGMAGSNTAARVNVTDATVYDLVITNYSGTITFVAGGTFTVSNNFDQASGTLNLSNITWSVLGPLWKKLDGVLTVGTAKLHLPGNTTVTNAGIGNTLLAHSLYTGYSNRTVRFPNSASASHFLMLMGGTNVIGQPGLDVSLGVGSSYDNSAPPLSLTTNLFDALPGSTVLSKSSSAKLTFRLPASPNYTTDVSSALSRCTIGTALLFGLPLQPYAGRPTVLITNISLVISNNLINTGLWTGMRAPNLIIRDSLIDVNRIQVPAVDGRVYISNCTVNVGLRPYTGQNGFQWFGQSNTLELIDSALTAEWGYYFSSNSTFVAENSQVIVTNMDQSIYQVYSGQISNRVLNTPFTFHNLQTGPSTITASGFGFNDLTVKGGGSIYFGTPITANVITNRLVNCRTLGNPVTARSLVIAEGTLTSSNSVVTLTNDLTVIGGQLVQDGGTITTEFLAMPLAGSGSFTFLGGTFSPAASLVANGVPFVAGNGVKPATLRLRGGTHSFADGLAITNNATLTGGGNVAGNLTLRPGSTLRVEVAGYSNDAFTVSGATMLAGTLSVGFTSGFVAAVTNGASFTLLTAGSLSGGFDNVANGATLTTSDGYGQFQVLHDLTKLRIVNLSFVDTDGDELPDWWEQTHFGGATLADAAADSDGDSAANLDEYRAGTLPRDPASSFRILRITPSGADFLVEFSTVAARSYAVERSTDLASGTWSTVTNGIAGTGSTVGVIISDTTANPQRFYRVRTQP